MPQRSRNTRKQKAKKAQVQNKQPELRRLAGERLPPNPLDKFATYSTYFILKIGRRQTGNGISGYDDKTNYLLLDTRGGGDETNLMPQISVRSFEFTHVFNGGIAKTTFKSEAMLVLFERGGVSYMQAIGDAMRHFNVGALYDIILWIGVGIIGWDSPAEGPPTATPISEKWLPTQIQNVNMSMENSGAEYIHTLIPWVNARQTNKSTELTRIKETIGPTFGAHMKDLMKKLNEERLEFTKVFNENRDAYIKLIKGLYGGSDINEAVPKVMKYTYSLGGKDAARTIRDSYPITSSVESRSTGGEGHVTSGGEDMTTVTAHIASIIKHCPELNKALVQAKQYYKIRATVVSQDETSEHINYHISPYTMVDQEGSFQPLRRYSYFFGGRNEDVLEFEFNMDGQFQHIGTLLGTRSTGEVNKQNSETSEQSVVTTDKALNPKIDKLPKGANDNSKNAYAGLYQSEIFGTGIIPPIPGNFGDLNNSALDRDSAIAAGTLQREYHIRVLSKLVENELKIRGDPNLILDEETLDRLGLWDEVATIVLSIGTPGKEFPDIPDYNSFLFSGNYLIRSVTSTFNEDGTFTQSLSLAYLPTGGI